MEKSNNYLCINQNQFYTSEKNISYLEPDLLNATFVKGSIWALKTCQNMKNYSLVKSYSAKVSKTKFLISMYTGLVVYSTLNK
jgi:hypothetical protein